MAKYTAIYEGRIPDEIHDRPVSARHYSCHHGITDHLYTTAIRVYKKYLGLFS